MLVLPVNTALVWNKFLVENRTLVYKYMVRQVYKGVTEDVDKIELFKFADNSVHSYIAKSDVGAFLEDALTYFIGVEEYEYAGKVDKLITSIHINQLLKESITSEG